MSRRRPRLTLEQILTWADAHRERTGAWPRAGPVVDAPGEKWRNIDQALAAGVRGLPGGDTLARLLDRYRPGRRGGAPRRRGRAWTPEEDALVRALPPREVAGRTGRSLRAVYMRRHALGLGTARRRQAGPPALPGNRCPG